MHARNAMVEQGSGKIVNIGSMWDTTGSSSVFPIPAYSAAKGAAVNLTASSDWRTRTSQFRDPATRGSSTAAATPRAG